MKAVELLPGHGLDDAKDIFFGEKVPGQVHVQSTVLKGWFVDDMNWRMLGV